MVSHSFCRTAFGIAALFLFTSIPAAAANGRDFAGTYDFGEAVDLGVEVRLSLSVTVFNHSDADANGATIVLKDPQGPGKIRGSFTGLSLLRTQSIQLRDQITIPKHVYDGWLRGVSPNLWITYMDGKGKPTQRKIELAPLPAGTERQP